MGEEELTRSGHEGPPSCKQQPGDGPRAHSHPHAYLPQEPPHFLQGGTQKEDVVPGQDQGGDLGEPPSWRSPRLMGLRGGRRRGGIGHHDLPQGVHGNVQVLHPPPLPAVDLPPELLLLLGAQLLLGLGGPGTRLEAQHRRGGHAGAQAEPWGAVGQVVDGAGATEKGRLLWGPECCV